MEIQSRSELSKMGLWARTKPMCHMHRVVAMASQTTCDMQSWSGMYCMQAGTRKDGRTGVSGVGERQ